MPVVVKYGPSPAVVGAAGFATGLANRRKRYQDLVLPMLRDEANRRYAYFERGREQAFRQNQFNIGRQDELDRETRLKTLEQERWNRGIAREDVEYGRNKTDAEAVRQSGFDREDLRGQLSTQVDLIQTETQAIQKGLDEGLYAPEAIPQIRNEMSAISTALTSREFDQGQRLEAIDKARKKLQLLTGMKRKKPTLAEQFSSNTMRFNLDTGAPAADDEKGRIIPVPIDPKTGVPEFGQLKQIKDALYPESTDEGKLSYKDATDIAKGLMGQTVEEVLDKGTDNELKVNKPRYNSFSEALEEVLKNQETYNKYYNGQKQSQPGVPTETGRMHGPGGDPQAPAQAPVAQQPAPAQQAAAPQQTGAPVAAPQPAGQQAPAAVPPVAQQGVAQQQPGAMPKNYDDFRGAFDVVMAGLKNAPSDDPRWKNLDAEIAAIAKEHPDWIAKLNSQLSAISPEEFDAKWAKLKSGETLVGPDGKPYRKQ